MSGSGLTTGPFWGVQPALVEPYRLINDRRRWYLVAWDVDRDAWRTFGPTGSSRGRRPGRAFTPRALTVRPGDRGAGGTRSRRGGLAVPGPGDRARARGIRSGRLPIPVEVEPLGEDRCAFEPGSDNPEMLALYLECWTRTSRSWTRQSWWTRCEADSALLPRDRTPAAGRRSPAYIMGNKFCIGQAERDRHSRCGYVGIWLPSVPSVFGHLAGACGLLRVT